ncbi:MATE family efflux transporter [Thermostichus vulcanus]|uniref:MATE family efflux transporter n=1 Tax=Thermostichus vulcanus str. 'Rupite' TaxID=2813851 RepID=A0ABT0CAA7_THEVL|nr:MATE family efflux transporter [Thermostichus vulcanus]MCJ2542718.1 MATE family efflux transporter [Thermostichus vulcanus str. 'Rupite']
MKQVIKFEISRELGGRFLKLSAYTILSNLMVPLAGVLDVAFLGHLPEIRHLAGVALATVIFNFIYWSFGFLRMSTTGLVAQAAGRGDGEEVWRVGLRALGLGMGIGLILLLLHPLLREVGFALLSGTDEVKAAGRDYFNARIWGAPAYLLSLGILGWFLGREQGRVVLILSLVGNLSNGVLNYIGVVVLGWGSWGAGLATAGSEYLTVLTGLGYWVAQEGIPGKRLWGSLWNTKALGALFALNGDIAVRTFALVLSFALFTHFSSGMGVEILAANTVLLQVLTLAAYVVDGFAFATESLAGFYHGRKQNGDVAGAVGQLGAVLGLAGGLSLVSGLGIAGVFTGFSGSLFGLITSQGLVLEQIERYTGWLMPVLGLGSLAFVLDGYFLGLTEGGTLRWASLFSTTVGFLPVGLWAWVSRDPQRLWLAMVCFMLARVIGLGSQVPRTLSLVVCKTGHDVSSPHLDAQPEKAE